MPPENINFFVLESKETWRLKISTCTHHVISFQFYWCKLFLFAGYLLVTNKARLMGFWQYFQVINNLFLFPPEDMKSWFF